MPLTTKVTEEARGQEERGREESCHHSWSQHANTHSPRAGSCAGQDRQGDAGQDRQGATGQDRQGAAELYVCSRTRARGRL